MDWESGKEWLTLWVKKYRYVLLILLSGVILMRIPGAPQAEQDTEIPAQVLAQPLDEQLCRILSRIEGVGKAEVLLTEAKGVETVYQTDRDVGQTDQRQDTVLVSDSGRSETGLVRHVLPPVYRGALIVCQGADSATVRLAVVEAVQSVTGLSSDCITVLKMK